jgi:hypothetical protein
MQPDQLDSLYTKGLESLGAVPEGPTCVVVPSEDGGDFGRCVATSVGLAVWEASARLETLGAGLVHVQIASASMRIYPWRDVSASVRSTLDPDEGKMVVTIEFEEPKVDLSAGRQESIAALAKSLLVHFDSRGRKG